MRENSQLSAQAYPHISHTLTVEVTSHKCLHSTKQVTCWGWGKCACPNILETGPGSGRGHDLSGVCHLLMVSVEEALTAVALTPS